ncbi:MAG: MBL fold metallo-hydrolase [Planctomycetota bacterium]
MSLIPAHQKDEALLADIDAADPAAAGGWCVWWLGQSGLLLKTDRGRLLFDPYLSDSLTEKYADTDKPHVRMSERAIDPSRLTGLDAVTSSHNHTDHLDAQTLGPLLDANPNAKLIVPEANRAFVADRLNIDASRPLGLDAGQSVAVGPFTIHGVAAAHNTVARDEHGRCKFMGYVATFGAPQGRTAGVYHSGDTLWHDTLAQELSPFDLDFALLPINGNLPTRRVAGNLWGQEAAALAQACGVGCVSPCHYDMFTFNTQTPDAFVAACRELGQTHRVLRVGERLDANAS